MFAGEMNPPHSTAADVERVAREVMAIEDVTDGVAPANSVRVRGRLLLPASDAWSRLAAGLAPLGRTPLLRGRADAPGAELLALPHTFARGSSQRPGVAALLFALTIVSCLFVGAQMAASPDATRLNWRLLEGLPFAGGLLAILLAHEFGHYLVARRLGSPTSLPYFIPMPFGPFGTLGAVITAGAPIRNRRHLLAIGAAGPLAGLVVAIPVLLWGLNLSEIAPALPPYQQEGNSLLYLALKYLVFGRILPAGGEDVWVHPLAFAGWAGLFVTGLNLLPVGQLDGGHIAYALLGRRRAGILGWIMIAAMAGLTFLWTGWALWLVLMITVGRVQDMPLDDLTELTQGQRVAAAFMLVLFVLVFVPVPLVLVP